MRLLSLFYISCLVLLINTNPLFAQWVKTNGPGGRSGVILTICVKDSLIFLGADKGIYRSKDYGKSWQNVNPKVPFDYSVPIITRALVVKDGYIFASMGWYGVYVSSNDGESWSTASNGLPIKISSLSLVVSGTKIIALCNSLLYQTTNNGSSWSVIDSVGGVISLMAQDSLVFVGMYGKILRSSDFGKSWTQVRPPGPDIVYSIAKSGSRVYAGAGKSIISSTDGGITWNGDSSALNCNTIKAIVTSPVESGHNYIFVGTDVGYSFLTKTAGTSGGAYVKPQLGYHNYDWNFYGFYNQVFVGGGGVDLQNVGIAAVYNIRFK